MSDLDDELKATRKLNGLKDKGGKDE